MKKKIGFFLTILLLVGSFVIPEPAGLSSLQVRTIGVLLSFLILLVTEALPVVVNSIIYCGLILFNDGYGKKYYLDAACPDRPAGTLASGGWYDIRHDIGSIYLVYT